MNGLKFALLALLLLPTACGPTLTPEQIKQQAEEEHKKWIANLTRISLPVFEPVGPSEQTLDDGKIAVTLTPLHFFYVSWERKYYVHTTSLMPNAYGQLPSSIGVEWRKMRPHPIHWYQHFQLKIENKGCEHVLRTGDSVVSIWVDGQSVPPFMPRDELTGLSKDKDLFFGKAGIVPGGSATQDGRLIPDKLLNDGGGTAKIGIYDFPGCDGRKHNLVWNFRYWKIKARLMPPYVPDVDVPLSDAAAKEIDGMVDEGKKTKVPYPPTKQDILYKAPPEKIDIDQLIRPGHTPGRVETPL